MKIGSIGYQKNIPCPVKSNSYAFNQNNMSDCFEFSNANTSKNISFSSRHVTDFLNNIKNRIIPPKPFEYPEVNMKVSQYYWKLAKGIQNTFGRTVMPKNLTNILLPEELGNLIPSFCSDNFIGSDKNIKNGLYFADLDCETNYTKGGKKNVFDLLDEVAKCADEYHAKSGNDFIFALADRDTLESARHAVRIIGENPEKFKHVKFIPAVKISYTHEAPNSQLKYENSNFIVYGINPFSDALTTFLENTSRKRKKMIIDFIKQVNKLYPEFAYSVKEFAKQNNFNYERDFAISNLYWRAREYAETKGGSEMKSIDKVPEKVMQDAIDIINQLGKIYVGEGYEDFEGSDSQIIKNEDLNKTIKGVFEKYSTHVDSDRGELVSSAENLFNDLFETLQEEHYTPVIAFAAPYYLCHDFESEENRSKNEYPNVVKYMKDMQKRSNGMIKAFQSVVPMYNLDKNLSVDSIKKFNKYIKEHSDLGEVGGSFLHYHSDNQLPEEDKL